MSAVDEGVPFPLSEAQVESFRRDGFLRLEAITDAAEIEVLRALFDELFRGGEALDAGDRLELGADTARAPLTQVVNPERHAPRMVQGLAFRNAQSIAQQLLGPACRPTGNHAVLKPAHVGGDTPWHQDEAYWDPRYAHRAVSIWIALQPATLENGCMRFIRGSHRLSVLPHELVSPDAHGLRLSAAAPIGPQSVCELPTAGASVHDGRTVHGAGANSSTEPRRALVFGFGLAPVRLDSPHHYPWQRPEWSQPGDAGR